MEGLNIAVDLIGPIPKLAAGDYGDLVQKVKRLGDHSHVQVRAGLRRLVDGYPPTPVRPRVQLHICTKNGYCKVLHSSPQRRCQVATTSHRLLALLAEGLGLGFQPYCKSVLGAMLLKLKDKKCVSALGSCLDKVYGNPASLDQVRP